MRIGDYQLGVTLPMLPAPTTTTTITKHAITTTMMSNEDEEIVSAAVEIDACASWRRSAEVSTTTTSMVAARMESGGPNNYLRTHVNSKLAHAKTVTTCRDALKFMEEHFGNADMILFRYGQKQPLDEMKNLLKRLSGEGTVDLAMGTEIHVPGKFITG